MLAEVARWLLKH